MSNTYFQFKKFRIDQDKTAMKVCTDSCILGAIADPQNSDHVLDIGAGTGLLSLMLAQKSNAQITAVEIEKKAFEQAQENFNMSPWSSRLKVFHTSIQDFAQHSSQQYDFIISNPPFFSNHLKSPDPRKNIAHHSDELSLEDLLNSCLKLLKKDGKLYVLLPENEFVSFKNLAATSGLNPILQWNIKDKPESAVLRTIGCFTFSDSTTVNIELAIKDNSGSYTEQFKSLLKEYYLIF